MEKLIRQASRSTVNYPLIKKDLLYFLFCASQMIKLFFSQAMKREHCIPLTNALRLSNRCSFIFSLKQVLIKIDSIVTSVIYYIRTKYIQRT